LLLAAAVPVYRDRPATITKDGVTVYVSVHDAEYLRQKAVWKQRLADAHPDRGGTDHAFRRLTKHRERWQAEEGAWYAALGLAAPDSLAVVVPERPAHGPKRTSREVQAALSAAVRSVPAVLYRKAKSGHGGTHMERVLAVLLDGQPHTAAEFAAVAGVTPRQVTDNVAHLRKRGVPILTQSYGAQNRTYQLVLPERKAR
jgi:biotin operon repressor